MISIIGNEFYHLLYIRVDKKIYFKAKEVATILKYQDANQAATVHVDDDKVNYGHLLQIIDNEGGGVMSTPPRYKDKLAIYKNISCLFSLILGSKKQESKLLTMAYR